MTVTFRILSLLLCLLMAGPMSASARAAARPENRVGEFFSSPPKSAAADLDQTLDARRESRGCGYDFASGVCKYLYGADDPVNNIDPSGHMSLSEQLAYTSIATIVAASYVTTAAFRGFAQHAADGKVLPDGVFLTVGVTAGHAGFMGGGNLTVFYDRNTQGIWWTGSAEFGLSPITHFKKLKNKIGRSIIVGFMFNMHHPQQWEQLGFTATWPMSLIRYLPRTQFPKEAFTYDTQMALKNTKEGITVGSLNSHFSRRGVVQFGVSSSGPSSVGFGWRDNTFSVTAGWTRRVERLVSDVPDKLYQFLQSSPADIESILETAEQTIDGL